uniref:P-type ATPase n=1 Tax=Candidatus Criblamydia sequanensis CRIB-18 TaxID=1437425 RepID=A0A090E474_9BACT|nr:cation-translocating P-type ATPase [Criblamydia sequanensis]CDR35275.1 P-type ATPase [Criblamydia sequanensis CRIB-18]
MELKNVNTWWTQSPEDNAGTLQTDLHKGLSGEEAEKRLQKFGPNQLPEQKRVSPLTLLINQFSSFIVWTLIAAAFIAGFLGEWVDATAIGVIVVLNGLLGFFQEFRADKSLAALRKMATLSSKVIRNGELQTIPSEKIVPGDLVLIEAGDRIPADGRITQSIELSTQEAALTGESMPIHKIADALEKPDLSVGDKKNMGFLGTVAVSGKGYMIVTETGLQTELGKIASLLQGGREEQTPLQIRLEELGHRLVWICLGVVALVFALGFFRGQPLVENLLISISLAVAAIPEGLPAIVTIALSIGVRKMAKRNALVRRLPSVETLGCTSVICTDKTGTLTQNEMMVRSIWVNGSFVDVMGVGYNPEGDFKVKDAKINFQDNPELIMALKIGTLCNSAELHQNLEKGWSIAGDPTEGALLTVAGKAQLFKQDLEQKNPILGEIPFDSERKRMSMARKTPEGAMLFIKGATDIILAHAESILLNGKVEPLTDERKKSILDANASLASQALRVLAVGYRPLPQEVKIDQSMEDKLILVGLIAMMDPPRPEVKKSIETCRNAGITTVMITGDHKETAVAVAKELNLMKEGALAVTGAELEQMDDQHLKDNVRNIAIYARTSAAHKLRIVRAWKSLGEVVAMTGDGVNDAPAIKEADIGVAMGITGTDVTKEASDMVILDDNFASIVNAVEEGRGIYDNIIKFVNYLMSSNIAELLVIFMGMLLGFRDPLGNPFVSLSAIQLLWLNLVTDGFPAIALGLDPVDPTAMNRPPRKSSDSIFPLRFAVQLFLTGFVIAAGTLAACHFGLSQSAELAQTMAFTTLVVLEIVRVQMVRSQYHMSIFSNPYIILALASSLLLHLLVVYTPFLQTIFGTVPLNLTEWGVILTVAIVVWVISTVINFLFKKPQLQKS